MATANDIMIRARRRLGVHADEEAYEAHSQVADFISLTDMLNEWALDDCIKSFSAPAAASAVTLTLDDDSVLTVEPVQAIAANLAIRLADDYSKVPTLMLARDAVSGIATIVKANLIAQGDTKTMFDSALKYLPLQRHRKYYR